MTLWTTVVAAALAHAALCDVRSRTVPDWHWAVIGSFGSAMFALSCYEQAGLPVAGCILMGSMLLLSNMLAEMPAWLHAVTLLASVVLFVIPLSEDPGSWYAEAGLSSAVMFAAFHGMYVIGLIRGGADAKCLMSLALSFPVYPVTGCTPLLWHIDPPEALVLNPSLSVFTIGLALSLAGVLWVFAVNVRRGDIGPRMLTTYLMPVSDVWGSHVWPAERLCDGALVPCHGFDDAEGILRELESEGVRDVRVTPMVPFILPLAVAFVVVAVLGSPLCALI